jgi:predicted metal-dependent enzyme (double-stranded beta helix superfamily)
MRYTDLDRGLAKEIDLPDLDPAIAAGDSPFIEFVAACEKLVQAPSGPIETRDAVAALTKDLASRWTMPDSNFRQLQPGAPYSSYQLYLNAVEDLSIVVDIFAPGQIAPIHNHCCWGVFVCLEGEELERRYTVPGDLSGRPIETEVVRNSPGEISVASPARNAFHQVECLGDVPATSLHIYGANIKALKRNRWDEDSGRFVSFQSGADPRRRQARHYLTPAGLVSALTSKVFASSH